MKNRKKLTLLISFMLSLQCIMGITYINFNDNEEKKVENIDPEISDIFVGNYTVPGVSVAIPLDEILKIGLLDDLNFESGENSLKGALLAAKEINLAGGIDINGTNYYVGIAAEDTNEANPIIDISKGVDAANRMIKYNDPHFIIGGYRTEYIIAYQDVVMNASIPFLCTGSAAEVFTQNVLNNYEYYKYFFRVMLNSTAIAIELITYVISLALQIGPMFGGTVNKVAILREDLAWTASLSSAIISSLSDWGISVVEDIAFPIDATAVDFYTYWSMIESAGAQITIPIISGPAGILMAHSYKYLQPKCLLAGLNVMAQSLSYWDYTEGACQYEINMGLHRTDKTIYSIPFWDRFVGNFSTEPFYTGINSYDAVKLLANVSSSMKSFNSNLTVEALENFNQTNYFVGAGGKIAFTNSHDLVYGYPYAHSLFCQWQLDGARFVVPSFNSIYPDSLATANFSIPYWGINNLVGAVDLPGDFILNHTADDPDKDGSFNLTWTSSPGADNYSVFIYDKSIAYISNRLTKLADKDAQTPFTISGLATGEYYCVVVAYNDTGEILSNNVHVTVERPKPGNFNLNSDSDTPVDTDGSFNLSWTVADGADNYSLYTYDGLITQINESVTNIVNQTTLLSSPITGLLNGDYFYAVMAYNATGETLSNNIQVKVRILPGNFTLSSDAETPDIEGAFNLTWSNSFAAENYRVYQYSSYITQINTSLLIIENQTIFNSTEVTGLSSGLYYYIIMAYNGYNYTLSNCIEVNVHFYNGISGYWELNPFIIDNYGNGDYIWAEVASLPWCVGSGTIGDPFIIEFLDIDGQNSGSCIEVRSSDIHFEIRSCSFYNSGSNQYDAGLRLDSVSYGHLDSLNSSSNPRNGIILDACQDIFITMCTINDNEESGIVLINCFNINIINNSDTINNNALHGIYLENSHSNEISGNTIHSNLNGIYLNSSNNNNVINNNFLNNGNDIFEIGSSGNTFDDAIPPPPNDNQMILIITIISIALIGSITAVLVIKKRISRPKRAKIEKEEAILEKKREPITPSVGRRREKKQLKLKQEKLKIKEKERKFEEELHERISAVDYLIKEDEIEDAINKLLKIQEEARAKNLKDIENKAEQRIELCKELTSELSREGLSIEERQKNAEKEIQKNLKQASDLLEENNYKMAQQSLVKIQKEAQAHNLIDLVNEIEEQIIKCKKLELELGNRIKQTILLLATKFTRLQLQDISEKSSIEDEGLIENVIQDMLKNKEIRGEYFSGSKSLALEVVSPVPVDKKVGQYSVFLSYSTLDTDYFEVSKIVRRLELYPEINEVLFWEADSKQNIVEFMEETLNKTNAFVLFCSEKSIKSEAVKGEWQSAYQMVKKGLMKIIPVYEDEDHIPKLLWQMLNVKFTKDDFEGFIQKLYEEILR